MEIKKNICGIEKEIYYDKKVKKLNFELGTGDFETPLIELQDWTKKGKSETLITFHIRELIELKSIIDELVLDWIENKDDLIEK